MTFASAAGAPTIIVVDWTHSIYEMGNVVETERNKRVFAIASAVAGFGLSAIIMKACISQWPSKSARRSRSLTKVRNRTFPRTLFRFS